MENNDPPSIEEKPDGYKKPHRPDQFEMKGLQVDYDACFGCLCRIKTLVPSKSGNSLCSEMCLMSVSFHSEQANHPTHMCSSMQYIHITVVASLEMKRQAASRRIDRVISTNPARFASSQTRELMSGIAFLSSRKLFNSEQKSQKSPLFGNVFGGFAGRECGERITYEVQSDYQLSRQSHWREWSFSNFSNQ